ncbi:hypothetical protein F4810DRAFT_170924 [Camillea tinctor]|nr:hypothetical protein F4810DRAFT_170924 [Camillea tinctor]
MLLLYYLLLNHSRATNFHINIAIFFLFFLLLLFHHPQLLCFAFEFDVAHLTTSIRSIHSFFSIHSRHSFFLCPKALTTCSIHALLLVWRASFDYYSYYLAASVILPRVRCRSRDHKFFS